MKLFKVQNNHFYLHLIIIKFKLLNLNIIKLQGYCYLLRLFNTLFLYKDCLYTNLFTVFSQLKTNRKERCAYETLNGILHTKRRRSKNDLILHTFKRSRQVPVLYPQTKLELVTSIIFMDKIRF